MRSLDETSQPTRERGVMSTRITVERDEHVLLIGINRPEKRNAFDLESLDALAAAYEQLGTDDEVRVGVLFAHGDHFSSGLDFATVAPVVAQKGPMAIAGGRRFDPWGIWGEPVPKPVVMAVQGIAYTLSIELALACDIVIASDDVRFRQLEIGRGILPFGGATIRAAAHLGWGKGREFMLTAGELGGAVALGVGMCGDVVPKGQHVDRARALAHLIARQAPLGVQGTLANARMAETTGIGAAKEHLAALLSQILASEDANEGMMSFMERREAAFTGK